MPVRKIITGDHPLLLFLFNAVGLPTYPSLYDKFLIAVGLVLNGLTVWYAWTWRVVS